MGDSLRLAPLDSSLKEGADNPSVSLAADSPLYTRGPFASLPPLCKGRWCGARRDGGIVASSQPLDTTQYMVISSSPSLKTEWEWPFGQ